MENKTVCLYLSKALNIGPTLGYILYTVLIKTKGPSGLTTRFGVRHYDISNLTKHIRKQRKSQILSGSFTLAGVFTIRVKTKIFCEVVYFQ